MDDRERNLRDHIASLQDRIRLLKENQELIFNDVWELLDAVMQQTGDAIWYNTETTAHERLVEIAGKYNAQLEAKFQARLEE